jgi:uncharacterized protein
MDYSTNNLRVLSKQISKLHLKGKLQVLAILLVVFLTSACSYNIYEAAHWGKNEKVIAYLNSGVDVNAPNRWGRTPLAVALFRKHYDTARMLIEKGADINVIDKLYDIALICYPIIDGDLEMTRYLTDHGADVNLASSKGFTALIEAAYRGHTDIGRLLLEHGADVDAVAIGKVTALSNAKVRGHQEFVKMLSPYIHAAQKTRIAASPKSKKSPVSDDEIAYKNAQKKGSIAAYEQYLEKSPNGKFISNVQRKLDLLYFKEATRLRTIKANQKYLERFPNGQNAPIARQRMDYLPLLNACLNLESKNIDNLLESGKSLDGYVEPAEMLMRLLQKQTMKTIRVSEFKVQGMQGSSKEEKMLDLSVFKKLIYAGADPDIVRIKGFKKPGRKSLDGVAYVYSTGSPGRVVSASEGGLSGFEFAEVNNLINFKKVLLAKNQNSGPNRHLKNLVAKRNVAEPKKVNSRPSQKKSKNEKKAKVKKGVMMVTLETSYFKEINNSRCINYKPDYSKYHTIIHLLANASIGKAEKNNKKINAYIVDTKGIDPVSGEERRIGFSADINLLFSGAGTRDNPAKMSMRVGEPGTRITFEGDENDPFEPIPGLTIWNGSIDIDPECGVLTHTNKAR